MTRIGTGTRRLGLRPSPLILASSAAALTAAAGAAYLYYDYRQREPAQFTLSYRVRDSSGKTGTATSTLPYLSQSAVDQKLLQLSTQRSFRDARNNRLWHWHSAQLPSNDPIEDALATAVLQVPNNDGNLMFFAVMDGHGGPWTSRLLSKILIPSVTLELQLLNTPPNSWSFSKLSNIASRFKSLWADRSSLDHQPSAPETVSRAIQRAFENIDNEIISAPLRYLKKPRSELLSDPIFPTHLLPARSGSCALLALMDTSSDDLYIASTGDCRAVAGFLDPETGEISIEELTDDQTGRNPLEVARIQAEHPSTEADRVIKNGRVLGGLEPSRAFGDSRYKWPKNVQIEMADKFNDIVETPMKQPPSNLDTPPYVTCRPEVTYKKLNFDPNVMDKRTLRFLVLATDGLWDELSSKEVASLITGHLGGLRGDVSKETKTIQIEGDSTPSRYNNTASKSFWTFIDDNIATHLIRNAFGNTRENSDQLRKLLSIPAPLSRRYRDDTSVLVLWWDPIEQQK